jgi:hypothetical protein
MGLGPPQEPPNTNSRIYKSHKHLPYKYLSLYKHRSRQSLIRMQLFPAKCVCYIVDFANQSVGRSYCRRYHQRGSEATTAGGY